MWKESIVYAQDSAPSGDGSPSLFGGPLFFMFMIFGIFYFLLIRPNQKRERERKQMLGALAKGNKVVTNGGICGTIVGLNDKTVVLKVSDEPATKIEFLRGSVTQVAPDDAETE